MSQLLMMVTIIRNIGATILKQLEVEHPAAKVLVELAQIQDREVGDGTTSVVLLAAELLKSTLLQLSLGSEWL
jgi:chaperonin GroEL (HSP60 family)